MHKTNNTGQIYRQVGTLIQMSMSADASCRGLRSHIDGPTVLMLSLDDKQMLDTPCTFPTWLTNEQWKDFSNKLKVTSSREGQQINVQSANDTMSYRCQRLVHSNSTHFIALSLVHNNCKQREQCMMIMRRGSDVLQMFLGHGGSGGGGGGTLDCSRDMYEKEVLLIRKESASGRQTCLEEGKYFIYTGVVGCHGYLRVGCLHDDVIDIVSTCSSKPGLQFRCLATWDVGSRQYMAVEVFSRKNDVNMFSSDGQCGKHEQQSTNVKTNNNPDNAIKEQFAYALNMHPIPCDARSQADLQHSSSNTALHPLPPRHVKSAHQHHQYYKAHYHNINNYSRDALNRIISDTVVQQNHTLNEYNGSLDLYLDEKLKIGLRRNEATV
ncbi:hypothetical protein HELRODRAFT_161135 [Helobdella robusta]|uniref:DUF7043 domain-containing protein n=1 Tax=Helobdella robusta TaxID=6412 RepID=T1ER48_HELRO|nr:hypothetical protein HELRODRAFT_161135 [Helobdella robusta]ESO01932.1 hypothetical protein HELRODRAFT_161135 [Helobdella robusta]